MKNCCMARASPRRPVADARKRYEIRAEIPNCLQIDRFCESERTEFAHKLL